MTTEEKQDMLGSPGRLSISTCGFTFLDLRFGGSQF